MRLQQQYWSTCIVLSYEALGKNLIEIWHGDVPVAMATTVAMETVTGQLLPQYQEFSLLWSTKISGELCYYFSAIASGAAV